MTTHRPTGGVRAAVPSGPGGVRAAATAPRATAAPRTQS
jgi:hypothetical protein